MAPSLRLIASRSSSCRVQPCCGCVGRKVQVLPSLSFWWLMRCWSIHSAALSPATAPTTPPIAPPMSAPGPVSAVTEAPAAAPNATPPRPPTLRVTAPTIFDSAPN
ncbi:hypothetical protein [Lysobacter gummosus]|uniref:hypothetical protein n=1 Tax=Lysobacter gummosus TaxID=262324 RepID=UPI00363168F3